MLPEVSIVISTFNRKEILAREIESIMQSDYPMESIKIIVIDDASTDNTSQYLADRFPCVKVIRNNSEKGPAASRNIGIKNSDSPFVFVLDDDNVLDKSCITFLIQAMQNDGSIGISAPAMYYYKAPNRIWCMGIKRNYITSLTRFQYRDRTSETMDCPDKLSSQDFPNAFMIRRKVVDEIGFFDENTFPIHYEEADFGERTRRAHFKIVCIPKAKLWHDISLPEDIDDKARLFHCHNEFRAYYSGRNRVVFHKKYSKKWQFLLFAFFFNWLITGYYLKIILSSRKETKTNIRIARAYLRGILHGLSQ